MSVQNKMYYFFLEAAIGGVLQKCFQKISRNSQQNICIGVSFFNAVAGLRPATLLKRRLRQFFSVAFCEIFKDSFSTEHLRVTVSGFQHIFLCNHLLNQKKMVEFGQD